MLNHALTVITPVSHFLALCFLNLYDTMLTKIKGSSKIFFFLTKIAIMSIENNFCCICIVCFSSNM
uniref:Uncharacterized protein n=1 Tax=Anguilla anguilla TaxID=7936 RepID=A0A0E9WK29_ANGAN